MFRLTTKAPQLLPIFFLYIILYLTYLVFSQGLGDFFILDDRPNLDAFNQGIYSAQDLYNYLFDTRFGGRRLISRLSFLINDNALPSDASWFKYTNVLIHLLSGIFLFILSLQLFKLLELNTTKAAYAALTVTTLWLLHPLNTSTVLYVIQRMAQLSTLFILIGLTVYLKGRLIVSHKPAKGYLLMSTGIGVFGILACLGKDNGILLSPLALILEYTILSYKKIAPPKKYWKLWQATFLIIPFLLPFIYFSMFYGSFQDSYNLYRDFSLSERLLTESHVLIDYLKLIFLPQLAGLSLFHDDYPITTTLFSDINTLFNIFLIFSLIFFGLFFRKHYPAIAFGILWFFIGHSIESTVLPLEIYFEHRNYLSMIGPIFSLIFLIFKQFESPQITLSIKKIIFIFLLLYLGFILFLQTINTKTWGDYSQLVTIWYQEHPQSKRAGAEKIMLNLAQKKKISDTLFELQEIIKKHPKSMYLHLLKVNILCSSKNIKQQSFEPIYDLAKKSKYYFGDLEMADSIRIKIEKNQCDNVDMENIITFLQNLSENASASHRKNRFDIYRSLAQSYTYTGDLNAAITSYDNAYQIKSIDTIPLTQAMLLASASLYPEALEYIEKAKTSPIKRQVDDVSELEILLKNTIYFYEKK